MASTPPKKHVPKLRLHKASSCGYVELNGHRVYLCKWDNPDLTARYHAILAKWERAGRVYPFETDTTVGALVTPHSDTIVADVTLAFLAFADKYYVSPDGTPTGQMARIKSALGGVTRMFADIPAADFGPVKLAQVRDQWIADGLARSTINSMTGVIKYAFKWAAAKEMIPAATASALSMLGGLKRGRSGARETEPVRPVLEAHIKAVLPLVSRQVSSMIQLQILTGARPGEIVTLKGSMINRDGKVWSAVLEAHKNAYRGHNRTIEFGPKAQEVLRPWLLSRPLGAYLFSPQEAEAERHAAANTHRSPFAKLNERRTNRVVGQRYTTFSYGHAIRRACRKAGVAEWAPNQLRHSFATLVRQTHGLEAAQVLLGHSSADVTQVYAERNLTLARNVIEKIG